MTCETCGREIQRVFIGSVETFGHVKNPAENHHVARPALRSASRFAPGSTGDPGRAEGGAVQSARHPASRATALTLGLA